MNDASFSANLFSLINPRDRRNRPVTILLILIAVCRRCLQLFVSTGFISEHITIHHTQKRRITSETSNSVRVILFFISNNSTIAAEREQYVIVVAIRLDIREKTRD